MSAVSAGMLIYAGTVEMLAADFVFGSVGGHSEGGGHGHSHGSEFTESEDHAAEGGSIGRKALAVGSLLAGVIAMGLVGS
ncbi:hypothetical protein C8J56DRAFT_214419 [Mycena floridula]|nr:hypothetical protein C8J56DRAFT_214419 [Mycena floridula]